MFPPKTAKHESPAGEVVTRHLESTIVETAYDGHLGAASVGEVLAVMDEVVDAVPHPCWLLDLTRVTSFDLAFREPGARLLGQFRERNGDRFAVAVSMARLRFLIAAVAYGTRLPLKVFPTRELALQHLRDHLRSREEAGSA